MGKNETPSITETAGLQQGILCESHLPDYAQGIGNRSDSGYLGSGIECARSPARSPYQSVSPAGSIAVGVARPSCNTVILAVSPLTVTISILPAAFSARNSLPLAARMPSGPLTGLSIQMSTGLPALPLASIGTR